MFSQVRILLEYSNGKLEQISLFSIEDESIQDNDNTDGNQNRRKDVSDVMNEDIYVDFCQDVFNIRDSRLGTPIDMLGLRVDIRFWLQFLQVFTGVPVRKISCYFYYLYLLSF